MVYKRKRPQRQGHSTNQTNKHTNSALKPDLNLKVVISPDPSQFQDISLQKPSFVLFRSSAITPNGVVSIPLCKLVYHPSLFRVEAYVNSKRSDCKKFNLARQGDILPEALCLLSEFVDLLLNVLSYTCSSHIRLFSYFKSPILFRSGQSNGYAFI